MLGSNAATSTPAFNSNNKLKLMHAKLNGPSNGNNHSLIVNSDSASSLLIRKDSVETLDSISSSNSKNSVSKGINSLNNNMCDSQDDLDYQQLAPVSPSSGLASPSVSSYLSSISNQTSTGTPSCCLQGLQSASASIPTRYVDRRVSSSAIQQDPYKYNVNYSEAGQRLARQAQEQLKIVDKLKEAKRVETNLYADSMGSFLNENEANVFESDKMEDWQSSVDDWKKRRREKQKEKLATLAAAEEHLNNNTHNGSNNTRQALRQFSAPAASPSTSFNHNNNNNINSTNLKLTREASQPVVNNSSNRNSSDLNKVSASSQQLKSMSKSESLNLSESKVDEKDEDDLTEIAQENVKFEYVEKEIGIVRPYDHPVRGFGFLISLNATKKSAQIVVVEPDSLAAKAGLEKNDTVLEINTCSTNGLNNDQLRKIMRERLQANCVDLRISRGIPLKGDCKQKAGDDCSLIPANNLNHKTNTSNHNEIRNKKEQIVSNIQHQAQQLQKQPVQATQSVSSQSSSSLMSHQNSGKTTPISQPPSPSKSTEKYGKIYDLSPTTAPTHKFTAIETLLAPKPFRKSAHNESQFNSVSLDFKTVAAANAAATANQNESTVSASPSPKRVSLEQLKQIPKSNSDTSIKRLSLNAELKEKFAEVAESGDLAPPLPSSEPPKLSSDLAKKKNAEPEEDDAIKKALMVNMKSIENWKIEQELLMKQNYEEEQKRIESSLKLNLEKVKEEESKRREEEKLKLEKEKLRLQDLELIQKEKELQEKLRKQNEYRPSLSVDTGLKKNNLNTLIEKIYDQVEDETYPIKSTSPKERQIIDLKNESILHKIVKITPEPSMQPVYSNFRKVPSEVSIHSEIKRVQDSMDNLKNELLHKDMPHYAKDVGMLTQNLEVTRKKQEEIERIKREQETLKLEKERIESEKEKLKHEAENLRKERELILLAATKKKQQIKKETNRNYSAIKPNGSYENVIINEGKFVLEQDPGYGTMNDLAELNYSKDPTIFDYYGNENMLSKSTPTYSTVNKTAMTNGAGKNFKIEMPSNDSGFYSNLNASMPAQQFQNQLYPVAQPPLKPSTVAAPSARKNYIHTYNQAPKAKITSESKLFSNTVKKKPNAVKKIGYNSQHWLVEEAERQRIAEQNMQSRPPALNVLEQLRRSVPNLVDFQMSSEGLYRSQGGAVSSSAIASIGSNKLVASQNDLRAIGNRNRNLVQSPEQNENNAVFYNENWRSNNFSNEKPSNKQLSSGGPYSVCAACSLELNQSSAMVIESLQLAFHVTCFRCSVCSSVLSSGKEGVEVRVRGSKLHCNNCFSNEQGINVRRRFK